MNRNHNLKEFSSWTLHARAAEAQYVEIDGVTGHDLLTFHLGQCTCCNSELTERQREWIEATLKAVAPIERGRKHVLNLLGLGFCRPGYNDYAAEYVVDFDSGETADAPADPTEWVEQWVANLCPTSEWWAVHRRELDLGVGRDVFIFGTSRDFLQFFPGIFEYRGSRASFPKSLPRFARVVDGRITSQVVVPFSPTSLAGEFSADLAYRLEEPRKWA